MIQISVSFKRWFEFSACTFKLFQLIRCSLVFRVCSTRINNFSSVLHLYCFPLISSTPAMTTYRLSLNKCFFMVFKHAREGISFFIISVIFWHFKKEEGVWSLEPLNAGSICCVVVKFFLESNRVECLEKLFNDFVYSSLTDVRIEFKVRHPLSPDLWSLADVPSAIRNHRKRFYLYAFFVSNPWLCCAHWFRIMEKIKKFGCFVVILL